MIISFMFSKCIIMKRYTQNNIFVRKEIKDIVSLAMYIRQKWKKKQSLPSSASLLSSFESPRIPSISWFPFASPRSPSLSNSSLPESPSDPLILNLDLSTRLIELTLGTLLRSHSPSFSRRSLISQLNIPGLSFLYCSILFSTSGVATRGLDPPMTPGRILPVSW